jgi:hypothetical protein
MSALRIYEAPDGRLVEQNGGLPRLLRPVCEMAGLPAGAVPVAKLAAGRVMYLLPDDDLVLETMEGIHLLMATARTTVTPDMQVVAVLHLVQDPWLDVGSAAPFPL